VGRRRRRAAGAGRARPRPRGCDLGRLPRRAGRDPLGPARRLHRRTARYRGLLGVRRVAGARSAAAHQRCRRRAVGPRLHRARAVAVHQQPRAQRHPALAELVAAARPAADPGARRRRLPRRRRAAPGGEAAPSTSAPACRSSSATPGRARSATACAATAPTSSCPTAPTPPPGTGAPPACDEDGRVEQRRLGVGPPWSPSYSLKRGHGTAHHPASAGDSRIA